MKNRIKFAVLVIPMTLALGACSTISGGKSGEDLSETGPSVVDARTEPGTFELNQDWQPTSTPKVVAQVKDFTSEITEVRLRFSRVPLQIPMTKVGGTTWEATLTSQQLQTLAVGGETMRYQANIIARNEDGLITVSPNPVEISVKAPIPEGGQQQQAGEKGNE